ncbi:VWA domain-containing protein [Cellvibrio sp. KY-GH-1]|uniref:vWA domain-containing protein n=1 Tax=Cellvibrio sp. KY-GH-1 TaxID=2303332 RepID=UPI0012440EAB|nr:VWA domain-containing protein [Cellvibrio sp. KY-GH-1]QEY15674.1 VWA domain-containing protein [Cellvibrio sp. KY-GH-1]
MSTLDLFHFLRPWWLLALVPAVVLALTLWYQKHRARQWQQIVAPELLKYLLDGQTTRINPFYLLVLLVSWVIACLAMAGPSWEKRPVAVEKNQQALVIMLDLSPSMTSEDLKPSRLVRARLKLIDFLRERKDGQTALLVYAGDVHVVTPLTDDVETIINIIPALHPNVMPAEGSNTEAAVERGLKLLKDAGIPQGDLLLMTDGVIADAQYSIIETMKQNGQYRLSVMGVGGTEPTPIPSSKGGFVRDGKRGIVTTQLNVSELQTLANQTRGRYRTLSNNSSDIDYLMNLPAPEKQETQKVDREFDSWYDRGHWLVILLLPVVLYCFRRGVLLSLLLIPLAGLSPTKSYALGWDDLWKNKNQQAYDQLQQEQATEAAQNFEDPEWKASAQYRAGDYAEAAKNFSQFDTANAHYNRGNALAKAGKLPEAIKAYDEALKQQPDLEDAKNNRQLVEDAIKQQQQKQDQQNQDQKQDKNSDQQNKQDQQQDQKNQQDQSQQNQDKQQNQDSQNQKNSDQNDQQQSEQDQSQQDQQKEQQKQDMKNQAQKDQQQEQQNNEQPSDKQQQNANQPKDEQQKDDEKKQAAQPAEEDKEQPAEQQDAQAATPADDGLTDEERQAMEQWLRRVPDDPGGLLRNKFNYEHYKRNQEMLNGEWSAPENGAEGRW